MSRFALDEFLPYQLVVVAARISREFSTVYRERYGITIPEWRVLAHLSRDGAVSVREIHASAEMDKSKVSRAAQRLEQAGYLTRRENPGDRRLIELELTDAGRELVGEIAPLARAYEDRVMRQLGPEAEVFRGGLKKLFDREEEK